MGETITLNYEMYKRKLSIRSIDDFSFKILLHDGTPVIVQAVDSLKKSYIKVGGTEKELYLNFYVTPWDYFCSFYQNTPGLGEVLIIESLVPGRVGMIGHIYNVSIVIFNNQIPETVFSYSSYFGGVSTFEIKNEKLEFKVLEYQGIEGDLEKFIVCVNRFTLDKNGFRRVNENAKGYLLNVEIRELELYNKFSKCKTLDVPIVLNNNSIHNGREKSMI